MSDGFTMEGANVESLANYLTISRINRLRLANPLSTIIEDIAADEPTKISTSKKLHGHEWHRVNLFLGETAEMKLDFLIIRHSNLTTFFLNLPRRNL